MNNCKKVVLRIRLNAGVLCDLALLLYFCTLFGHQQETSIDKILRYGSLFFLVTTHIFIYPYFKNKNGDIIWRIGKFEMWMLLFWVYGAVSILWCIDASNVYRVLFNLVKIMLACFVIRPHLNDREAIHHTIVLLLIALVYMAVLLLVRTPQSAWGTERIGAVINLHSNEIGRLTCLGSLLSFYLFTEKKNNRILWLLLTVLFAGMALLTGSKNAILILVFQFGAYYFFISGNWKRILVVAGIILAVVAGIHLLQTNEVLYNLVGVRFERMFQLFTTGTAADGSTNERLFFMQTAWKLFKEKPLTGIGLNNFSAYLKSVRYSNAVYSHTGFLELLSTLGIIGFTIYYVMYVRTIKSLSGVVRDHDKLTAVLLVINLRVFIFDVTSISLYTYNSFITLMLGYCLGCVLESEKIEISRINILNRKTSY
ncbi:MAG: O-antigen ligase family protein [Muricoprocola sp.]